MEAIKQGEDAYEIETLRCIGCGVCVPTCPEEAISLIEKSNVKPVPENMFDTSMKIAAERGLM
jgi:formate hydrogenlyase subunit 6/NADH:ubiquinone oxidoreductase subunit I